MIRIPLIRGPWMFGWQHAYVLQLRSNGKHMYEARSHVQ